MDMILVHGKYRVIVSFIEDYDAGDNFPGTESVVSIFSQNPDTGRIGVWTMSLETCSMIAGNSLTPELKAMLADDSLWVDMQPDEWGTLRPPNEEEQN